MDNKILAIVALVIAVVGLVLPVQSPLVQTGLWTNFPCGLSDCTGAGCFAMLKSNNCDLFNDPKQSYYGALAIGNVQGSASGLLAGFSVNCISPAVPTQAGSVLYLQYANYSDVTYLNVSNFKTLGQAVYIDNTNGWPCPGVLESDGWASLPAINPATDGLTIQGFEFRVIGVCGCGGNSPLNGGNPVINDVEVLIAQAETVGYTVRIAATTTTKFIYQIYASLGATVSTTVPINWVAVNQTSSLCGVTDICIQSGSASGCVISPNQNTCSASQTVNFVNTFTGTPKVITSIGNITPPNVFIPIGAMTLFADQIGKQ